MRMFKREKYPTKEEGINMNVANDGRIAENSVAQNGEAMPYTGKPSGAARVLIAARTLFPGMQNDDAALDLLMDMFEERIASAPQSANAESLLSSLYEDEKRLKKIVPGFSISKAFENEEFKRLVLDEGADLFTAYEKLNPVSKGEKVGVIDEVGSTAYAATPGSSPSDIAMASDEEFKRYIKGILEDE